MSLQGADFARLLIRATKRYFAPSAWRRSNSIVSRSLRTSATPTLPPGTQIRSRLGHDAKAQVGKKLRPQSLGTGSADLATMCVAASGNRARTCSGPVKSSCVSCGKITKPMFEGGHLVPPSSLKCPSDSVPGAAMGQFLDPNFRCPQLGPSRTSPVNADRLGRCSIGVDAVKLDAPPPQHHLDCGRGGLCLRI